MRISGYTFDARLYQGSATLVYAGKRDTDGLPIIGKIATGGLRDLQAELEILRRVAGPGVVEALGLLDSSEGPALVQHRFGDGSLSEALRGGPLAIRDALRVGIALSKVIAHIHARRILHRDLKPSNVLLDSRTGEIALADFGIAAELPFDARMLPPLDLIGTPAYLAPEQTGRTSEGCDVRSDLYSFGVVLYELLVGKLPFATSDLAELVSAHLSKVPEAPSSRRPTVPAMLSAIVMRLLAKSRDDRYQSARGVAADLSRCLETLDSAGKIAEFELGRSDLLRPRAAQRLYGRDVERAEFAAAVERVEGGTPSLVLVSGEQGTEPQTFIERMIRTEAEQWLCASAGWRERGERPLSGLSQALSAAASEVLLREDHEIAALREALADQLGQLGQVIVDVAPRWEHVIGPQPALTPLGPRETRTRLQHAFRCFVRALGEDGPFVLCLSDLDRADTASLDLIQSLLESDIYARMLIVGSVSELSELDALCQLTTTRCLRLESFSLEASTEWLADQLACEPPHCAPLATVLYEKTGGNPSALAGLLEHLIDGGVVERCDGSFVWDLPRVRSAKAPPTQAAYDAQRVAKLATQRRDVLAAIVCGDDACGDAELAAMLEREPESVVEALAALERESLITASSRGGYAASHPRVAESTLAVTPAEQVTAMRARLATYLLESRSYEQLSSDPFRVAQLISRGQMKVADSDRERVARLYELAANQATALAAYDDAASFFENGAALAADASRSVPSALLFSLQIGLARSLMMLSQNEGAEQILASLCTLELSPYQLGITYQSRASNRSASMDRVGAVEVGLEGLTRLGFPIGEDPSIQQAIAVLMENEARFVRMTPADHVGLVPIQNESALAAITIISTISGPILMTARLGLYVYLLELALKINLEHGYTRYYAMLLSTHSTLMHSRLGNFDAARRAYQACLVVQEARPAPEIDARTHLVLYYAIRPWFSPWKNSIEPLERVIDLAIAAGDPLVGATAAHSTTTLMWMSGTPLDHIISSIEGFRSVMRADGGVMVAATNVLNISRKLVRGEQVNQADLDALWNMTAAARSMRNSSVLSLGLALCVIGHGTEVRKWIAKVREEFPATNPAVPHLVTIWLLEGIFAASDVRAGRSERLADVEKTLDAFKKLQEQTGTENHLPAIRLIEGEMARALGATDLASGLYGRATSAARALDLTHIAAYAMEQRAAMLDEAGCTDEADLFYRESVIAYRRWSHMTKVLELERARPLLRALELTRSRNVASSTLSGNDPVTAGTNRATKSATIHETLDLQTVLEVSQQISTQMHGSDVVRVVLAGIGQNAGAQRVVFVLRGASVGELVYGEIVDDEYRDIRQSLDQYVELPRSVLRLARRTASPIVVADAASDPGHASDPYVVASGCRSIAIVPFFRKGSLGGFVLLENRLVPGAFSPQLVGLTQSLVTQAAISLDNASLYEHLESRVHERTAELNARTAEMRMLFDNVSQGLMMVDRAGKLSAERSAILERWFAGSLPDQIGSLFAHDPMFEMSWEQLLDGIMPVELCIAQLPRALTRGQQTFAVGWQPIVGESGELARILVVLSDVTDSLRRQQVEREQQQMMALFERLARDRNGVVEFVGEATGIVKQLSAAGATRDVERRLVHTLKGNSALMGLKDLSGLCHDVESGMLAEQRGLSLEDRVQIRTAWSTTAEKIGRFLHVNDGQMQVPRADYEALRDALVSEGHPLARELQMWDLEPLEARYLRIAEQARELATRLGKAPVRVEIDPGGIRTHTETWAAFWSAFVHAVRNAIDHGLETREDRAAQGKGIGTLSLRTYFSDSSLVIDFSDDGKGIAWERVREKAQAAGLPSESREDLVAALFRDGISTKERADELSGRGVGMAALAQACAAMGGTIQVESEAGRGTMWRFSFPRELGYGPRGQTQRFAG